MRVGIGPSGLRTGPVSPYVGANWPEIVRFSSHTISTLSRNGKAWFQSVIHQSELQCVCQPSWSSSHAQYCQTRTEIGHSRGELSKLHRSCGSVWLGTVPENPGWREGREGGNGRGDMPLTSGCGDGGKTCWGGWFACQRGRERQIGWDRIWEEMGSSKVRLSTVYFIR